MTYYTGDGQEIFRAITTHEPFTYKQLAARVGCTEPRVHQVIRDMRTKGYRFDKRTLPGKGAPLEVRLLTDEEVAERDRRQAEWQERQRRQQEVTELRSTLEAIRDAAEQALGRLPALAG